MGTVLVAVFLTLVAVGAGLLVLSLLRQDRLGARRRVLVNLVDGKALQGLLWSRRGRMLILKDVTLLESGAQPAPVDGEVLIEATRVDFVQVL